MRNSLFIKEPLNKNTMKTVLYSFITTLLLSITLGAFAQPSGNISPGLTNFKQSEFMVKFADLRIEAENMVTTIDGRSDEFDQETISKLRTYYDQTADRANNIMDGIKNDFLDKKKLKMIVEFPDMYSEGLRYKLTELSDFYSNNFQQTLADAQVIEEDGSALLLIIEIVGLTKNLVDYYRGIKKEARQYNEAYLNTNLVQPYRWKSWTTITTGGSSWENEEADDDGWDDWGGEDGDDIEDDGFEDGTESDDEEDDWDDVDWDEDGSKAPKKDKDDGGN